MHTAQQFDGKEGVATGLLVKRLAERYIQEVGFTVQKGCYELATLSLTQIDLDLAPLALELVDHGL